jgi:hypothetical protein
MRKGQLNKTELARMARCFREIESLMDMLPKDTKNRHEQSTWDCLIKARNGLGELLRWQDFGGAWQDAQKENTEVSYGSAEKNL